MANVYAVGNGNASVGATWNTGNIPTVNDDVYTNNYTVTVDANVTWLSARNTAAAGITAGGKFLLANGVTVTCTGTGVVNGTVSVFEMNLASPNAASIISTTIASALSNNTGGITLSGTGQLNITATTFNYIANGAYNQIGINVTANGILNVTGDVNFQTTGNFIKVTAATPTIVCNCNLLTYGNSSTNSLISNGTSPTTATVTWNGILFGSNGTVKVGPGYGINTTGICTVNGSVTGGTYSNTCHAILIGDGATVTVNGGTISSASIGSHAIYSTSLTSTILVSGTINNVGGYAAINTRKLALVNANTTSWLFQTDIVGTNKTLYSSDNVLLGYPAESDTRESVIFGQSGEFEGTLIVPPVNTVLLGVPTDNTVGTLVPGGATTADIWDHLLTAIATPGSIGDLIKTNLDGQISDIPADVVTEFNISLVDVAVRMQNASTVDTTGNQLAALP